MELDNLSGVVEMLARAAPDESEPVAYGVVHREEHELVGLLYLLQEKHKLNFLRLYSNGVVGDREVRLGFNQENQFIFSIDGLKWYLPPSFSTYNTKWKLVAPRWILDQLHDLTHVSPGYQLGVRGALAETNWIPAKQLTLYEMEVMEAVRIRSEENHKYSQFDMSVHAIKSFPYDHYVCSVGPFPANAIRNIIAARSLFPSNDGFNNFRIEGLAPTWLVDWLYETAVVGISDEQTWTLEAARYAIRNLGDGQANYLIDTFLTPINGDKDGYAFNTCIWREGFPKPPIREINDYLKERLPKLLY